MSIFDNIGNRISKALPFKVVRKPTSKLDMVNYGWLNPYLQRGLYGDRAKNVKITWTTYYNAMDNEWVSGCIDAYVIETLAAGFDIYSDNPEKDDPDVIGYMTDLWERPDGIDGRDNYVNFIWKGLASYLGPGDWFAEIVHDDTLRGLPIGMYFIQPHRMNYYNDTDQWGIMGTDIKYENDELIHVMIPDPWNELWGKSMIDKAAKSITMDILGMKFNKDWFDGGMSPKNFISYDSSIPREAFESNVDRIELQAKQNPRGTYFLHGGTFQEGTSSLRDMEFGAMLDRVRDRIVATYGVPPQNMGIYTAGSLGNERDNTADKKFKKRIQGKVFKIVENEFNNTLGKSFNLWGFEEKFHFGDIDVEDKQLRANIENMMLRNGTKIVNEVRGEYGLDPTEYGDKPLPYVIPQQPSFTGQPPQQSKSLKGSIHKRLEEAGLVKFN